MRLPNNQNRKECIGCLTMTIETEQDDGYKFVIFHGNKLVVGYNGWALHASKEMLDTFMECYLCGCNKVKYYCPELNKMVCQSCETKVDAPLYGEEKIHYKIIKFIEESEQQKEQEVQQ